MGLNIPNIYRVIHSGPAGSVDQYVQESGRGGCNGCLCEVVLYLYSGATRSKISAISNDTSAEVPNLDMTQLRNYVLLAGAPASGGLTCYGASYTRQ